MCMLIMSTLARIPKTPQGSVVPNLRDTMDQIALLV